MDIIGRSDMFITSGSEKVEEMLSCAKAFLWGCWNKLNLCQPWPIYLLKLMLFLSRYTEMALHWAEWVAATPSQRRTFYKDTIWDPERRRWILDSWNFDHKKHWASQFTHLDQETDLGNITCLYGTSKLWKSLTFCYFPQGRWHWNGKN